MIQGVVPCLGSLPGRSRGGWARDWCERATAGVLVLMDRCGAVFVETLAPGMLYSATRELVRCHPVFLRSWNEKSKPTS